MKLRPYQRAFVDGVFEQFGSHASTLGVMATGLGKTVCFAHCVKRMHENTGKRAMVIAHREELINQAADKIAQVIGERPDIEMADQWADNGVMHGKASVVVASKDSLQRKRLERFDPNEFGLIVTDEAHHAVAGSYKSIYQHFEGVPHLGVTATPDRADEAALGKIYESVAFEYGISDGVNDGWLVPIRQTLVDVDGLDYSGVHTVAGELNKEEVAAILEEEHNVHQIAEPAVKISGDRKTLIFAHSLNQAEQLCDVINRHKPDTARWVSGETPKDTRRMILHAYATGFCQYLVNVGVFTEGFDEPGVQCVVMARPTKSRSLFTQMIGRGTRPLPGIVDGVTGEADLFSGGDNTDDATARREAIEASAKPYVEVIDFVGNCGKHKLVSVADVLGGNYADEIVERAKRNAAKKGAADMAEELRKAEHEIAEGKRRERERRRAVKASAEYRTSTIDPFDVLDITPWRERGFDRVERPSEKQVAAIARMTGGKIDASEMTKRQASQLLGELIERSRDRKCTFGQARILNQYGYATDVSFGEASAIIDQIKANGWKRSGGDLVQVSSIPEFVGF